MVLPQEQINPTQLATASKRACRRRISFRRRKMPTVRLGGGGAKKGLFFFRILKKMKLRWLKLKYLRMLKRLKGYYLEVVKDLKEARPTLEAYHHRLLMECAYGVPVMGIALNNYPSIHGSERPRSLFYM